MSGILRAARCLMSLLAPLTGNVSTGSVTATATSSPLVLPRNTYGVGILSGSLDPLTLVKTTAETTVTAGGTSVPIRSVLGGQRVNLAAGTTIRWDPAIPGLQPTAIVLAPGMTGGTQAVGFGAVAQVRLYESTGVEDLFKTGAGLFPALVLVWSGSDDDENVGRTTTLLRERWVLAVVASRTDGDETRRAEALQILEDASELIHKQSVVDGEVFTAPQPVLVNARSRIVSTSAAYIYGIQFSTVRSLEKHESRVFPAFEQVEAQWPLPGTPEASVVTDVVIPIPIPT
ncbi:MULTISPECIES: hypothetical protein [Sorangium]|uniref:Uncharacterized protein n=1 Tax=Sorangium cellulosum TaxID=56 RepID=A0A4P2QPQ9_SORCE|nr:MULTISPECIES: hypothetical protein [Sorangium]AUX31928.1 uncharacterized protein SOCE836_040630 [Sorangium cellulosum]WCQ91302.1 portal protein [Sorangium sp. Soce836]